MRLSKHFKGEMMRNPNQGVAGRVGELSRVERHFKYRGSGFFVEKGKIKTATIFLC